MEVVLVRVVQDFILSLDKATLAKTLRIIDLLEKFGYALGMPHSKKILPKLFELRITGDKEIRIFYTLKSGNACLLHGFVKKTQKIPSNEIQKALNQMEKLDT